MKNIIIKKPISTKRLLSQSALTVIACLLSTAAYAELDLTACEDKGYCQPPKQVGKKVFNSRVSKRALVKKPANTEKRSFVQEASPIQVGRTGACKSGNQANITNIPFRISIDGEPLAQNDKPNSADISRCTDKALEKADIQVRFDPLEQSQALNVTTFPRTAVRGEEMSFTPYSNYTHYITKAELRIFKAGESTKKKPFAVIAVDPSLEKEINWLAPRGYELRDVQYILRVYNKKGKFDETAPKPLKLVDQRLEHDDLEPRLREKMIGYGENHLAVKNIPVSGGIVTINGANFEKDTKIRAMGADVHVDKNGKFAYRQILPAGHHSVDIATRTPDGRVSEFTRSLYIPDQDWFYIALADLTIGKNNVSGDAALVTGDNSRQYRKKTYVDGRLAFYTKGKIKGKYLLTASADTREQPFEDLFSNFTDKDPRYLLKRIDPNAYYPVYGDDSTTIEDAPTQGKFYVKLEREDSHVLWGNFQTKINGTDLFNYSRTLYGANAEYVSSETTSFGENKTEVSGFAADPGSISSLEEFRGTGGSLYYLRGQDVVVGSERLRVEIRDRDSGIVLDSQPLTYGQDYEVNYIQGRVVLREPLTSTSTQSTIIQTGNLSGNPVFLVAGYEYAPSVSDIENLTKGGHASHWVNDHVKLGVTAYSQNGEGRDQKLMGVDATIRYAPGTYIKAEGGRSKGAGNGALSSRNGGFNFADIGQTKADDIAANAYRAEVGVDLSEVTDGEKSGTLNAYTLRRQDGFSSPGQLTSEEILQHGLSAKMPVSDNASVETKLDYKSGTETGKVASAELIGNIDLSDERTLNLAIRHDDRQTALGAGSSAILSETGNRTDVAVKYNYAPLNENGDKERYDVYGLLQGTLSKSDGREFNNRIGIGARYDVTDRISLNGESSYGNNGWGGLVGAEYAHSDRTSYYMNYLIDTDRSDIGYRGRNSSFTLGGKSRYSDNVSVFAEERYQTYDTGSSGLIHSFGLDIAANDRWTWGGRFENGTISDVDTGDIDRTAISLSTGYNADKTKYASTIELRLEDGDIIDDRRSWLMRNNLAYQTTEDWRFLGDFDFAFSDSGLNGSLDANFVELGLGYAYRPVDNDRFNALVRYEFLKDTPSPAQLAADGSSSASDYAQRSHVLSADAIYDLTPKLALGGKIGYRFGELKDTTVADSDYFSSQALLLIGRADYHIVKEWDIMGELRYLDAREAGDAKAGGLLGVYRQFNNNIKAGVGYNFTDFSDDLTDLDYESRGPFVNVQGKF